MTIQSLPKHGILFLGTDRDNVVDESERISVNQVIDWADATTNGLVKFKPDADWSGNTQFLHSVNDPWSRGTTATVDIRVQNDCPVGPIWDTFPTIGSPYPFTAIELWNSPSPQSYSSGTLATTSVSEQSQDAVVTVVEDDAPEAGTFTVSGNENAVIVVAGWNYTDAQSDSASALKIEALPETGSLFLDSNANNVLDSGEAIVAGQEIGWADATTNGLIKFVPGADFTGDVTVTYAVSDGLLWGASAAGAITVNPVVDPDVSDVSGSALGALRFAAAATSSPEPLRFDGEDWYEVKIWEVGCSGRRRVPIPPHRRSERDHLRIVRRRRDRLLGFERPVHRLRHGRSRHDLWRESQRLFVRLAPGGDRERSGASGNRSLRRRHRHERAAHLRQWRERFRLWRPLRGLSVWRFRHG